MRSIKSTLKLFVPPIVGKIIKKIITSDTINIKDVKKIEKGFEFEETSMDWKDILKKSKGYDADNILEKCKNALLKVKNGEYPYERDSVVFDTLQIFFPLLSALFYVALQYKSELNLIDFGGSLGSTYYQNKDILKAANVTLSWNIVEQKHFVKCGKKYFETDELRFMYTVEEIIKNKHITVCLLSGVLQYLENPYEILEMIYNLGIEYVIIDRTSFVNNEKDILTIQNVYKDIYEAKYPAWFFSKKLFEEYIGNRYNVLYGWDSFDFFKLKRYEVSCKGYLLRWSTKNGV